MKSTKDKASAYAISGVDIDAADAAKKLIKKQARSTFRPEVLTDIGLFGAMFEFKGYCEPVLVSSTDGVGTKLKIAALLKKYDTVGIDLVNHCINDILCCGAEPLFFLDYIATGKLVPGTVKKLVGGVAKACKDSNCALIGGETAEMPGIYAGDDLDLAGFIVGAVEKRNIITGKNIAPGDIIIGLPSSGLHTNGYSLVRRIFGIDQKPAVLLDFYPEIRGRLGESLLEPHRCYYSGLKPYLKKIKGLAHITGGGFSGNIPRILPPGVAAKIDRSSWEVPPLFKLIQKTGKIDRQEMYRVFNMGIGMVVICEEDLATDILRALKDSTSIGKIVRSNKSGLIFSTSL